MKKITGSSLFPRRGRVAGLAVALMVISTSAFGTAISTGEDNTAGVVLVNSSGIFFSGFTTTGPDTGAFAGNTTVTQGSLVGTPTLTPGLTDWASFAGTTPGPIMFDLQTLTAGIGTNAACSSNAVGTICTPTGSAITLIQIGTNTVELSLTGNGISYTGTSATGSTSTVVSFTTQNNLPGTITEILAAVNSTTGFQDSVSATYTATSAVPEPMTVSMLGIGLLGLGLISRKRRQATKSL